MSRVQDVANYADADEWRTFERHTSPHNAGASTCQFDETETDALAAVVVQRESETFDAAARVRNNESWGWEQDTDGCCGYDLWTAAAFKHYAILIDVSG